MVSHTGFEAPIKAQRASFALANGALGVRASVEELPQLASNSEAVTRVSRPLGAFRWFGP